MKRSINLLVAGAFALGFAGQALGQGRGVVPPAVPTEEQINAQINADIEAVITDLDLSNRKAKEVRRVLQEDAQERQKLRREFRERAADRRNNVAEARRDGRGNRADLRNDRRELRKDRRELRQDRRALRRDARMRRGDRRFDRRQDRLDNRRAFNRGRMVGHRQAMNELHRKQLDEKLSKYLNREQLERFHELQQNKRREFAKDRMNGKRGQRGWLVPQEEQRPGGAGRVDSGVKPDSSGANR